MPPKPKEYRERIKVLHQQAKRGDVTAMEELHRRYHINKIMIDGKLVDLKDRLLESSSGVQKKRAT
ncbi:MAG: hypothetical protein GTO24_26900 [candidate division Zixibacteria bacterium]|nr:hypothetical protein [candidate division Zixibacteria bacterium]